MSERFIEIDAASFIAEVGELLRDMKRTIGDDMGVLRVSQVEFTIEYAPKGEGEITNEGLPILRRQGLDGEWPLALVVTNA